MTLAGIWDEWQDAALGLIKRTYSVVTTRANKTLAKIHNNPHAENGPRMPIILTKGTEQAWLKEESEHSVLQIAQPYADSLLETYTVRKLMGKESVGNLPEALQHYRYAELEESQGSLF
jgi:putative SOS response-associated peptidase YedK